MYSEIKEAISAGKNVFITGPAGTGKSYTLDQLKRDFPLSIAASTGIAAINVGGTTLHSFAGIGLGDKPAKAILNKMGFTVRRRIHSCRYLAVDEISMINGKTLDLINEVFKKVRKSEKPFGGVQLLVFGDFLQLPPVDEGFAFNSDAWDEANFEVFNLTKIYRQDDLRFMNILQNIREGRIDKEGLRDLTKSKVEGKAVNLFALNRQSEKYNSKHLEALKTELHTFEGQDYGDERFMKACITPKTLEVKVGARVMLTMNLDLVFGLVNGAMGTIVGINYGMIAVRFDNGYTRDIKIEKVCEVKRDEEVLAYRLQYPLRLAWAISIHKSQGMTLEKVRVDMSGIFEFGQAYVALSRAKTIEGLEVNGFDASHVSAHPTALKFYREAV